MNQQENDIFAREWIEAWNAHDLDRILSHYSEDFEMNSPFIVQFEGVPSGRLVGRKRVAAYWQRALERSPDLHFELLSIFVGANSLIIHYKNQRGRVGAEVFFFGDDGLVYRSAAHYQAAE